MAEMKLKVPLHQFPSLLGLMAYLAEEYNLASDFDEATTEYEIPIRWTALIPDMMPAVDAIWAEHQKEIQDQDPDDGDPYTRVDRFWQDDDYNEDSRSEVTLHCFLCDWDNEWSSADSEPDLLSDTNFAVKEFVNKDVSEFETVGDLVKYLSTFDPAAALDVAEDDYTIYLSEIPWPVHGSKKLRISTEEL